MTIWNAYMNYWIESWKKARWNLNITVERDGNRRTVFTFLHLKFQIFHKEHLNNRRNFKETATLCLSSSLPIDILEYWTVVSNFVFPVTIMNSFWSRRTWLETSAAVTFAQRNKSIGIPKEWRRERMGFEVNVMKKRCSCSNPEDSWHPQKHFLNS